MKLRFSTIAAIAATLISLFVSRVQADEPYRGWAHIVQTFEGQSAVRSIVKHVNFANGFVAVVSTRSDGAVAVRVLLASAHEKHVHAVNSNEIELSRFTEADRQMVEKESDPTSIIVDNFIAKLSTVRVTNQQYRQKRLMVTRQRLKLISPRWWPTNRAQVCLPLK